MNTTHIASATPSIDALVDGADDPLVVRTLGDVRLLILNRPKVRNALSMQVRQDFWRLTQEADKDPAVRSIIITGAHGFFSAGVDLKEFNSGPRPPMFRPHPGEAARAVTKPFIAAIDGPCVTGGLEIALSCSFIIASDRARFADTHAKVGLFPAWGQSALLPRAIGTRRARQMSLTGTFIDAQRAYEWGLVNELTSAEGLLPRCLELAAQMSACDQQSVEWQVDLFSRNDGTSLDYALASEAASVVRWRAMRDKR